MIVNVNMCASMFDETFHVMKFSAIAKKVRSSLLYNLLCLHFSAELPRMKTWIYFSSRLSFNFCYFQVTTRVTKPVDLPPPSKKARASAATPRSKPARPSVPWANGALATPAPPDDAPILEEEEEDKENEATTAEIGAYQQVCREG